MQEVRRSLALIANLVLTFRFDLALARKLNFQRFRRRFQRQSKPATGKQALLELQQVQLSIKLRVSTFSMTSENRNLLSAA